MTTTTTTTTSKKKKERKKERNSRGTERKQLFVCVFNVSFKYICGIFMLHLQMPLKKRVKQKNEQQTN
jgi:hypothetical protein